MTFRVRNVPSWVNRKVNRKGVLRFSGNSTWKGQPVVGRIKVSLSGKDDVTGVRFDRMMQASYDVRGTRGRNRFVWGPQAGAITKRVNTVVDFRNDEARDVLVFRNTTPKNPVVHMQRFRVRNFGSNDIIRLKNLGITVRQRDLRRMGDGRFMIPGVDPSKMVVMNILN
jgi:hypothetical protein